MAFDGFPRGVRSIPVPSPLFGPLLEQIDDLAELKATLRVIWLLHQKRGHPRFLTRGELVADRTLTRALAGAGVSYPLRMDEALARAVARGTLITGTLRHMGALQEIYALNTESDRRALSPLMEASNGHDDAVHAETWETDTERPNIFALYEDNIGMLNPMIADELREAEQLYPAAWIEHAFRESVSLNKRSWRYIARILERWDREGMPDGEPRRHHKKAGYY